MVARKRNVAGLVSEASGDIQGTGASSVRRGRGVDGMFDGQGDEHTSVQVYTPTSTQAYLSTSTQVNTPTGGLACGQAKRERISRSYRVDEEIAHAFDVLAVQQRRKLYEALEEAMLDYLAKYEV